MAFYFAYREIEVVRPAKKAKIGDAALPDDAALPEMDAENVDEISGVKVWECSLDLSKLLEDEFFITEDGETKLRKYCSGGSSGSTCTAVAAPLRVLELGCGHAVPAIYFAHAWQEMFDYEPGQVAGDGPSLHMTLQDYSAGVLKAVTRPNVEQNLGVSATASATAECDRLSSIPNMLFKSELAVVLLRPSLLYR